MEGHEGEASGERPDGPFEIVGKLGEGATGVVYEAHRRGEADGPRFALKVIHRELLTDPQVRGRFAREAAILRRLDGQHLCPIVEFGEMPDPAGSGRASRTSSPLLYLALPKLEGESLDRLLARGPLPIDRALRLAVQVCAALDEAHRHGVIHRDLKPHNVIVAPDDHVTVVDFGMAKIITGAGTGTTALTQHNMVFGTPEYMAPEQARGDDLDRRCDVYAAGVILYEMLTGAVPFAGATPLNVLTAALTQTPKAPRERAPERAITPALETVVLAAMAKEARDRYESAAALSAALVHASANPNDAIGVRPLSLTPLEGPADGHSITMVGAPLASSAPPPLPTSSKEGHTLWVVLWIIAALVGVGGGVYLSLATR
ncbi:MAG: serine/threonine protein kinase [Myxococcales bacterium]|nr:serine/threonine protein kinase [Myxococcales bacterium]